MKFRQKFLEIQQKSRRKLESVGNFHEKKKQRRRKSKINNNKIVAKFAEVLRSERGELMFFSLFSSFSVGSTGWFSRVFSTSTPKVHFPAQLVPTLKFANLCCSLCRRCTNRSFSSSRVLAAHCWTIIVSLLLGVM